MSTTAVPGTCSSLGFTTSRATSYMSAGGRLPRSASLAMGASAGSNRRTIGSSISVGSLARATETRARSCCSASLMSIPSLNSATTVENPSWLIEVTCLRPGSELSSSSSGLETSSSTSCGPAPRYTVMTAMAGMLTSGNMSTPRFESDNNPTTIMEVNIAMTKVGRRTARAARFMAPRTGGPGRPACRSSHIQRRTQALREPLRPARQSAV